jgi:LysR family hydrogen peroxide-inducible transcriptional activator
MTLTELRYVVTLAQLQHFGKAAERCNVNQSTLSIAVKKLEGELGIELFERSKSSVRPTPIGEKVIAQSQRVLEEAGAIKDIALSGKDQLNSPLHVGAIFTIGPYLFPQFIPHLQKSAAQMPLIIEESYTSTLRKRLRNGEVDVIIVALPFSEPDVVVQPLYDEPFVVLLPKAHPLSKKKTIERGDLDSENVLMLGEGHCFRDQVIEALPNISCWKKQSASVRTMTEGSSLETLCYMVASGLGITILPQTAARGSVSRENGLVTRPFAGTAPLRTTALAWRASFPRHRAIDALRKSIYDSNLSGITLS